MKQETGLEELTTTRVQKGKKKKEKRGTFAERSVGIGISSLARLNNQVE